MTSQYREGKELEGETHHVYELQFRVEKRKSAPFFVIQDWSHTRIAGVAKHNSHPGWSLDVLFSFSVVPFATWKTMRALGTIH